MARGHSHRRLRSRHLGSAVVVLFACLALWGAGLVWFSRIVPQEVAEPDTRTDAIVVLTGGAERLRTGLELLARSQGEKLFISGVYRGVDVREIFRVWRQGRGDLEHRIELGYTATDTVGNARETAAWMAREGFRSLRLVTANYHMPRSLVEFRRVMPGIVLVAHPVFPAHVRMDAWWRWPGTASLLAGEFNKYLFSLLRPNDLPPS